MGPLVRGDVVVLPFPFDDFTQAKRRPALVVATPTGFSPVLAQITSQIAYDAFAVALTSTDFQSGAIHKDSFVRANILFTVNPARILYLAGRINAAKILEVTHKLVDLVTK